MIYYKITNKNECHRGFQYVDGLNILVKKFEHEGSCVPGGLYFSTAEYVLNFINYGENLREVIIPNNSQMVIDPDNDKMRSDKLYLGKKYDLSNVETIKMLVNKGADLSGLKKTMVWSIVRNYVDIIEYLRPIVGRIEIPTKDVAEIIKNNSYHILKKYYPECIEPKMKVLQMIFTDNNNKFIKLMEKYELRVTHFIFYFICLKGNLALLQYLHDNYSCMIHNYLDEYKNHMSSKHSEIYTKFISQIQNKYNPLFTLYQNRSLKIIKFLHKKYDMNNMYDKNIFDHIVQINDTEILKFVFKFVLKQNDTFPITLVIFAIKRDNIPIITYILENIVLSYKNMLLIKTFITKHSNMSNDDQLQYKYKSIIRNLERKIYDVDAILFDINSIN